MAKMEALLRLGKFRNWRIVEAADSMGVRRQCLLLPMEMNGIFLTRVGKLPFMRFSVFKVGSKNSDMFAYGMVPVIPKEVHDSLVAQGLASADDEFYAEMCGGIRYRNYSQK